MYIIFKILNDMLPTQLRDKLQIVGNECTSETKQVSE